MGTHTLQIIALSTNSLASLNWSGRGFASESDLYKPATFASWHRKYTPLSAMFLHLLPRCGRISDFHHQLVVPLKEGYRGQSPPHLPISSLSHRSLVLSIKVCLQSLPFDWAPKARLEDRFLTLKEMMPLYSHWCPPSQSSCLGGTVE